MKAVALWFRSFDRVFAVILASVLVLASCSTPSDSEGGAALAPGANVAQAAVAREGAPVVPEDDLAALVAGNQAFALDMYQAIREQQGNLFFSPYSISQALAMTYAGARGKTEQEMASTMHFNLPQAQLHPAFNALDQALASHGKVGSSPAGSEVADNHPSGLELAIANALWAQQGMPVERDFLDTLARNYGSGVQLLDFAKSEGARRTINAWVSDQTKKRIDELLPAGSIDEDTAMVLTNAIYFNASWADEFDPAATSDGPFTLLDGSQVEVPMMKNKSSSAEGAGPGYVAAELPYYGQTTSMVIVMPDPGSFAEFEAQLTPERLDAIVAALRSGMIEVTMPKFEIKGQTISLKKMLRSLGMEVPFDGSQADFSGIVADWEQRLVIDDVLHQAFVAVDEQGTEAAAATAVTMFRQSVQRPGSVTIDHPFLFLIRDRVTGTILFMGRVVDPRG